MSCLRRQASTGHSDPMPIRYEGPKVIAALSPHIVIPAKAGPTGASVLACAPKSGAKLPISCPGLPYPPSPCSPLSGATDLACTHLIVAVSDQSGAELPLPCPDWPYLPFSALWPTFRGHRPRLHTPNSCCVRSIWRRTSPSVSRLALPTLQRPVAHFQGPQTSPAPRRCP